MDQDNMLSRRAWLGLPLLGALSACAGSVAKPPGTPTPWDAAANVVSGLATGLGTALTYLNLSPSTAARYRGYLAELSTVAQALLRSQSDEAGKSLVARAVAAGQELVAIGRGLASSSPVLAVLFAAADVALGALGSYMGGMGGTAVVRAAGGQMSVDEALRILRETPPR